MADARTMHWHMNFHGLVHNESVPGKKVAMYEICDGGTFETLVTVAVPPGRADIVQHIVDLHNATIGGATT